MTSAQSRFDLVPADPQIDPEIDDEPSTDDTIVRGEVVPGVAAVIHEPDVADTELRGAITVQSPSTHSSPREAPPAIDLDEALAVATNAAAASTDTTQQHSVPTARVRIGDSVIELTAPVVIGRRPQAARVIIETPPRLVIVASPNGEVSASHVSVAQSGRVVVVTDLHSTNGTLLSVPGSATQRLRGGESVVVAIGSTLDLGDGIRVEILRPRIDPNTGRQHE